MPNQEPGSPPRTPGQEGIYVAVLRLRREAANPPSTRADALHLRRLARDFDRCVAEVRARYTAEPELAVVADFRAELAAKQRLALAAIARKRRSRSRIDTPVMALE
jgi:hypothetical protein